MKDKLKRFMIGRYGVDSLGQFLNAVALTFFILFYLTGKSIFNSLGSFVVLYAIYRILSKDHGRRIAENRVYYEKTNKIRKIVWIYKNKARDLKNNHIYKCPNCSQKIRVPRGKGKIEISCPKCRTKFIKKS